MKRSGPPRNVAELERLLRATLAKRVTIRKADTQHMRDRSADVEWAGDAIVIRVDPNQVGWIAAVIHELVHVACDSWLEPWSDGRGQRDSCDEIITNAFEQALVSRLDSSHARTVWWARAIRQRMR